MKIEKLCSNKITFHHKVIKRSISNFNIIKIGEEPIPYRYKRNNPIGIAEVEGFEKLIYEDKTTGKKYWDKVKFTEKIKVYNEDHIVYDSSNKYKWPKSLEKRFEVLYFEGLL